MENNTERIVCRRPCAEDAVPGEVSLSGASRERGRRTCFAAIVCRCDFSRRRVLVYVPSCQSPTPRLCQSQIFPSPGNSKANVILSLRKLNVLQNKLLIGCASEDGSTYLSTCLRSAPRQADRRRVYSSANLVYH